MLIVLLRTVLVYLIITVSMRLMGKRQLAQLQPGEFVVAILVSNIATLPLQDTDIPLIGGIIPLLCLMCLEIFSARLAAKSRFFRSLIYGREQLLIEKGVLNMKVMQKLRFTADDLMDLLRSQGIFDLRDVDYAVVQTDGSVSVFPRFSARNVTNGDLDLKPPKKKEAISFVTVSEGSINVQSLSSLGLDEAWLLNLLKKRGKTPNDVFLMTAKSSDDLHIIWKDGTQEG